MTKKRAEYIYQFKGKIKAKILWKSPPTSQYPNQEYYKLRIVQKDQSIKQINVFQEKVNPNIWETLQTSQRGELSKRTFAFSCRNVRGYYYLVDWEKLPSKAKKEVSNDLN